MRKTELMSQSAMTAAVVAVAGAAKDFGYDPSDKSDWVGLMNRNASNDQPATAATKPQRNAKEKRRKAKRGY